jgi:hypothetical protein
LLEISVTVLTGIGFKVGGVRQTVPPLETVLPHYCDDAAALGSETLAAART